MAIFKFTEARVRDLPLGSGIHRDTEVKGLMCIAHKTTRTYAVQGDVRRNKRLVRSVRVKIGKTDHIRLAEARKKARELMNQIQSGVDPTAGPEESGITLEQALEAHLSERDLRERTASDYRYHVEKYLSRFRRRAVADISRQDVRDLYDQMRTRNGPTVAAGVMRSLRALVNTAMRLDETIKRNPVEAVRVPQPKRRRVGELDVGEFWLRTGDMAPCARDLARAFLLTGARRSTLLSIRREDVDLERGVLRFGHMKTMEEWAFPMGPHLTRMVAERMEADVPLCSEWLWPSTVSKTGHVEAPRRREGVPSPHELRHHARTLMIAAGVPYAESALLLGQRLPGASGGYVHQAHLVEALRPHAAAYEALILREAGVAPVNVVQMDRAVGA
ncbi:integrase family protein [Roseibacterium beibuensis]|uniref:Integrase family protein n=1 Tax=[Roseibacterium] beibuensis TaxID=1193142 RepID=A0ABP9L8Y4_9RHOB|nr:integrase family protein [Roseibacterium beibuensis]MCS6623897.1 integrase family protein [Roseibacterium beibuensis]